MKENKSLLAILNELLACELGAIGQYMVDSEMCDSFGYDKLHKTIETRAIDEMHHASLLIRRIIALEGTPVAVKLKPIKVGHTVPDMMHNNQKSELATLHTYNKAIGMAHIAADQSTADLLSQILKMEEDHADWAVMQRTQIEQMGLENYLANQTSGAASQLVEHHQG